MQTWCLFSKTRKKSFLPQTFEQNCTLLFMIKTKNHNKYCCLSHNRDMEGAAEAAIERRNESEINTVLSRCSATTDHLLMERLNRAKATAVKK